MTTETYQQLHIVLFPFMSHGHMLPTLDIARLLIHRGVKATIITTPHNVHTFTKRFEKGKKTAHMIAIEVFRFPAEEVGLPDGCENMDLAEGPELLGKFFEAAESEMVKQQMDEYLEKIRPTCIIADMFFPWTTEIAAKFNIPRLVFHGTSYFSLCVQEIIRLNTPYRNVSDEEPFILPFLPHEVELTRLQLPVAVRTDMDQFGDRIKESELTSYGTIVNSFYELEPDYANFFTKELGRRAWHIGPVALWNIIVEDKAHRGGKTSVDENECLKWLDTKAHGSVIYISFGSSVHVIAPQLHEIAFALEASHQGFVWVMRKGDDGDTDKLLPPGFEQRMKGKGLIIRGWAPQVLILEHEAIGAFVTHCGWNSTLEGISAGVPMVTWPVIAEQFYNEKLVIQILKTGIPVGAKKWMLSSSIEDVLKQDMIERALREVMTGEEAEERRCRAKRLKEMARKAIEEGGSSYSDLSALLQELRVRSAVS